MHKRGHTRSLRTELVVRDNSAYAALRVSITDNPGAVGSKGYLETVLEDVEMSVQAAEMWGRNRQCLELVQTVWPSCIGCMLQGVSVGWEEGRVL